MNRKACQSVQAEKEHRLPPALDSKQSVCDEHGTCDQNDVMIWPRICGKRQHSRHICCVFDRFFFSLGVCRGQQPQKRYEQQALDQRLQHGIRRRHIDERFRIQLGFEDEQAMEQTG